MVVLAVSICSKGGKTLLSRQFVEMTRIRIEGALAAFPKLIGSGSKQHTFVETDSVRYVYQPIEELYVVLITTKGSNIMEDLHTLRLLSKLIPSICPMVDEDHVLENAFDIIFAFDEVITLGYKENVTEQAIQTNLEMESHEEKLHDMIKESKISEARETMEKKQQEIKQMRKDMAARGIRMEGIGNPNFAQPNLGGQGSSMGGGSSGYGGAGMGAGVGGSSGSYNSPSGYPGTTRTEQTKPKKQSGGGMKLKRGMQLKKKEKDSNFMEKMIAEDDIDTSNMKGNDTGLAAGANVPARTQDVDVNFSESLSLSVHKDGGVEEFNVNGQIQVACYKPDMKVKLQVAETGDLSGYQMQVHPTMNKPEFNKNRVLVLKDVSRSFSQDPSMVLKWRMNTKDESKVPLEISCWPQESGDGVFNINIEYNLQADIELHDVLIKIPLNSTEVPEVANVETGMHRYNSRYQQLEWNIDVINADSPSGTLEFNIEARDEDGFFPVTAQFSSFNTLCPLDVSEVVTIEGDAVRFANNKALKVDRYEVVAL